MKILKNNKLNKYFYKLKIKIKNSKLTKHNVNVLFPLGLTCNYCKNELKEPTRSGLCGKCESKLKLNNGKVCEICGRPNDNQADYCIECMNTKMNFDIARSPLIFDGIARKLIIDYKFYNKRYLATYFVNFIFDCYLSNNFDCNLILPIPIHKKRLAQRGFNQSELIAKQLAEKLKIDFDGDILIKSKLTKDQVGLSKDERLKNIYNCFEIKNKDKIKGKNILLIDDVLTTGTTVSECSRILKKAGANTVNVITIATVDKPQFKGEKNNY